MRGIAVSLLAGACLAASSGEKPAETMIVRPDEVWRPIDMTALSVQPGSALDLSGIHEPGPAGKYGRVMIGPDGTFRFEKQPEKPVRFFAFNAFANHVMSWKESMLKVGSKEETHKNIREFAAKVRRQGYNMVRFQGVDLLLMSGKDAPGRAQFSPSNLDCFQYMLHCLKQEGVYFGIDLFSYTGYEKFNHQWDDAMAKRYKERMYFDPVARQMWLDGVKALMTGKNPYTGLTLNEEPALIYVDLHNEQELGIWIKKEPLSDPEIKPLAEAAWRAFLKKRYGGDIGRLSRSWKENFTSFDVVPLFVKKNLQEWGAKGKDANDFLYGVEREMLEFYRKGLKEIGCRTFATLYDVLGYFRFTSIRRDVPVITAHGYHNHPTANNNPGSRMDQYSLISNAAVYLRYMSTMRVWNRPFLITEYNAPFWGRYRHQEGLLLPSYAALQNYDGITVHSLAVTRIPAELADFQLGRDPIGRAGQVIAAFAFGRGDVATARHKVGIALSDRFMRDHRNMNNGVSSEQNRLTFLTGLGVVLDGKIPAGLPPYPKLDLTMLPIGGSRIEAKAMFTVPVDTNNVSNFAAIIDRLRTAKILPPGNLTDPAKGVFQSDTGELIMRTAENRLTVNTPRLKGVAWNGETVELSGFAFQSSVPCTAALISLDKLPLERSRRMLLVFSTDALNSNMELSADRKVLHKAGTLPVLLETGRLTVELPREVALKCFALGIDGSRREELPLRREGGRSRFSVDTAKLQNGPSLYFEFAEK